MSIAGCSQSIKDLLASELAGAGALGCYSVNLLSPCDVNSGIESQIGIILYRVENDPDRRNVNLPRTSPLAPGKIATALELHYLLVVWGKHSALAEQVTLGDCMYILDRNAVISGPLLSAGYDWEDDEVLRVTLEPLPTDELMQIWGAMNASYQLSVGYVVRTVRLAPSMLLTAGKTNSSSTVLTDSLRE